MLKDALAAFAMGLWLISEACQTSMSARIAFKWLYILLEHRQPAVIHHTTGR